MYGFQWRHFGAQYKDMHTDYTGMGVDQLQECINKIKNDPTDRRIIMSAWNPAGTFWRPSTEIWINFGFFYSPSRYGPSALPHVLSILRRQR